MQRIAAQADRSTGGLGRRHDLRAERMIETVEARVPSFRSTIVGRAIRTPQDMADELHWPGAHPMSMNVSADQLG